jgi:3',5'-cyclic AMP phosphodiesterase CpdA
VSTSILHVSDLHVGAHGDPVVEAALRELVEHLRPALVVASGDLTHRGRRAEHERAAGILRSLACPVLAVPGNHDIPAVPPARLTSPWRAFEEVWGTTEPRHSTPELHVVGVNSVRPWRHQSGGVGPAALERAGARLREAPPGALRVVVLHHQLVSAPWRTRKRPLAARDRALAAFAGAGAELVGSGHVHQGAIAERREFEVDGGACVLANAPGLGRPRPHRRGEAQGCLQYRWDERELTVETYVGRGAGWELVATRTFPRGRGGTVC